MGGAETEFGVSDPSSGEEIREKIEQRLAEDQKEVMGPGERKNPKQDGQGVHQHGLRVGEKGFAAGGVGVP